MNRKCSFFSAEPPRLGDSAGSRKREVKVNREYRMQFEYAFSLLFKLIDG